MVGRKVEPEVELSLAGHNLDRDEKAAVESTGVDRHRVDFPSLIRASDALWREVVTKSFQVRVRPASPPAPRCTRSAPRSGATAPEACRAPSPRSAPASPPGSPPPAPPRPRL